MRINATQPFLQSTAPLVGYSMNLSQADDPGQKIMRLKQKLENKDDEIILLEKTNIALNQKLLSFKDKYSQMKRKFKAQIYEREIKIDRL
jgi:hypothetical protein